MGCVAHRCAVWRGTDLDGGALYERRCPPLRRLAVAQGHVPLLPDVALLPLSEVGVTAFMIATPYTMGAARRCTVQRCHKTALCRHCRPPPCRHCWARATADATLRSVASSTLIGLAAAPSGGGTGTAASCQIVKRNRLEVAYSSCRSPRP